MAATGASLRAILILRFEMTRVFSGSPNLTVVRKYRNETWCRRWKNISRRSLSSSSNTFAPILSPVIGKEVSRESVVMRDMTTMDIKDSKDFVKESKVEEKNPKESKTKSIKEKVSSLLNSSTNAPETSAEVVVEYHRGLPRIKVPLPSRRESCFFTLKPITHTVGDFLEMLKCEDRGIDRASITTIDGTRIGFSNTIESLMEEDFKLIINDNVYTVAPPVHQLKPTEGIQQLSDIQTMITQLYDTLHVREHHADMEKRVLAQLEVVRLELEPLEQQKLEIEMAAARRANLSAWAGLVMMSVQFGILARLTWWEYSWDIMEPVTYFVTYGTAMLCYVYFLLTRQEYMLPDALHRQLLVGFHKKAKKIGFDLARYNVLKDQAYELETTLKIIRGPLWEKKHLIEKREERRSSSSSSSSSSSRSRSRSDSRSPSPSPKKEPKEPKEKNSVPTNHR
ncbi:calcium uniporter protein, mitochondrial isoform X2 [Leptopilina heterotoma]|uniref:calcium uniporter protein, mitochondrial isoform X2 n=1 Tax=Leptopilina heterotoma TaxID=63436 RepID=UPI001CA7F9E7|nr:calcium uniporter protein, mitochondrial isoform X2 [Leptopilina heterotoma]